MSANRDMASLLDIVQACQMIQRYIAGIDRDGLALNIISYPFLCYTSGAGFFIEYTAYKYLS